MRRKMVFALIVALYVVSGALASGSEVSDHLKDSVDRIITVLKDPALKVPGKTLERRNLIFKIVEERFDFTEMAKRSVGEFWYQMPDAQQKEFELSFSGLLENTYITRIEKYTDEKIVFGAEKPKNEMSYSVHTSIVSGDRSIPVVYSLHKVEDQWLVYDVNIEGVSLVTNYLTQFREAVHKNGFEGLMAKLEEKQKKVNEE